MSVKTNVEVRCAKIDLLNPPENLEEIVAEQFGEFTHGTAEDYTDDDRLSFIENIRRDMYDDETDGCREIIHKYVDDEIYEYGGDIPTRDDYNTVEMMTWCYEQGLRPFDMETVRGQIDHHDREKAQHTLCRIIKTVMNWEYKSKEGR